MQEFKLADIGKFRSFSMWSICCKRRDSKTLAVRIEGPFRVEVPGGSIVTCSDGYLALDSDGRPYPIEADEFAKTYEEEAKINGRCLFADRIPCPFCSKEYGIDRIGDCQHWDPTTKTYCS